MAVSRANAPDDTHHDSNLPNAQRSMSFMHQRGQDDDGSSYDSLNHVHVEEHINSVSQGSHHQLSGSNPRAAAERDPRQSASSDDDEVANTNHYRHLLSSITSKMRENKLGGGGIQPFEIDHSSAAPVPCTASFSAYPAPASRSRTFVGETSSGQAATSLKSSEAAVSAAASAAHSAYARPFSSSVETDKLRPFDVAAVEERMKLMRQSYLDQVRAIASSQAKAFTLTAPSSMSARRMSQLATPGGQLRSMKGTCHVFRCIWQVRSSALHV
jgi:hypothetical protein